MPASLPRVVFMKDQFKRFDSYCSLNYQRLRRILPPSYPQGALLSWSLKEKRLLTIKILALYPYNEQLHIQLHPPFALGWLNAFQAHATNYHDTQQLEVHTERKSAPFCQKAFYEKLQLNEKLYQYLSWINECKKFIQDEIA